MPTPDTKTDPKRRALGKGLESLLPARPAAPAVAAAPEPPATGTPMEIPLDKIERNPFQTRITFDDQKLSELANSIAASGVVQPIVVRPLPDGRYQLIMGERRWLASRRAGKNTIPAIVRVVNDAQAMEMTIVENLQRADLNPMEQARAYERLGREFAFTQEHMALRTGQARATVANFLRLLRLPETVQAQVASGILSFGHAKAILALESHEQMGVAAQKINALSLSVRQTETYISNLIHPERRNKANEKAAPFVDPNVKEAQGRLQQALGMKVTVEDKGGKGRVIIEYAGLEDFDMLLNILSAASN